MLNSHLMMAPTLVDEIDIRKIHPSKHSLRGELLPVDELALSILEMGLLEPIVVRPAKSGFEVVAGNRRLDACKKLKMSKVTCHILELDDREAYEASLIENIQRSTLNPIEEADAFKKYVDDYGFGGASELARRIGKSPSFVSRRIALLTLPKCVREELLRRRKSPSVAQELISLDNDVKDQVAEFIADKTVTQKELRKIVRQVKEDGCGTNYHDGSEAFSSPAGDGYRERSLGRVFAASIATLKLCMTRLDDIYDHVDEDEWMVREVLMRQRKLIHSQVDDLLKLRRRTLQHPPPLS